MQYIMLYEYPTSSYRQSTPEHHHLAVHGQLLHLPYLVHHVHLVLHVLLALLVLGARHLHSALRS
jgi:hypothetical protein